MSTATTLKCIIPRLFTDHREHTRTDEKVVCFAKRERASRDNPIPLSHGLLKRKENSFQGPRWRHPVLLRHRSTSWLHHRNINLFPFLANVQKYISYQLRRRLGLGHSRRIKLHVKPFSTSAFKVFIWIVATNTKICTRGSFTGSHDHCFDTTSTPSYSSMNHKITDGWVSVNRLSAIHFQGYLIRQVSCYTLLSGFRLPWPPSCCLNQATPFMVSKWAIS